MAVLIKANGEESVVTDLSLENLQKLVDGYIEIVPTIDGRLLVLNEEGKIIGLPKNPKATKLTNGIINQGDYIVGDVVVGTKKEID